MGDTGRQITDLEAAVAALQAGNGGFSSVKWVDCGVVSAVYIATHGKQTLYTPTAGEFIASIRYGDTLEYADNAVLFAFECGTYSGRPDGLLDWYGEVDVSPGSTQDSFSLGVSGEVYFNGGTTIPSPPVTAAVPLQAAPLTASISTNGRGLPTLGVTPGWQSTHAYGANDIIIAAGHFWSTPAPGTSGGSTPDFAGHLGGSVTDGGITWSDTTTPTPTQGLVHVYAEVLTPT